MTWALQTAIQTSLGVLQVSQMFYGQLQNVSLFQFSFADLKNTIKVNDENITRQRLQITVFFSVDLNGGFDIV